MIRLQTAGMNNLKLVLFDCDGTLADSHAFLTRVLEDLLSMWARKA